jgi:hypothetical protein
MCPHLMLARRKKRKEWMWWGNENRAGQANGCVGLTGSQPLATICCVAPLQRCCFTVLYTRGF